MQAVDRAVVFVDGSNWYHGLKSIGVTEGLVDYRKLCAKLLMAREWRELRWYVGRVDQSSDASLYADQRRHMDALVKQDRRISVHWGRIERRPMKNEAAAELETYLGGLRSRIDKEIWGHLFDIARRHQQAFAYKEKAVDVQLAVDMVRMAIGGEYETAYLLSADGDFTPAVQLARSLGKKVIAASAAPGYALKQSCDVFVKLEDHWFDDCVLPPQPPPPPPRSSRGPWRRR